VSEHRSIMNSHAGFAFLARWARSPLRVASVTPSSARLARAMVDVLPDRDGPVIELGGGTGPVTQALLDAAVSPDRLTVIERDAHFHQLLGMRFPGVNVLLGDAVYLERLVATTLAPQKAMAVVSSLPMVLLNARLQHRILCQALRVLDNDGVFVQFSYGLSSPLKQQVVHRLDLSAHCVARVWRNVPPARVWVYRARAESRQVA
jgi:phosphatidylethanolamine/phosphatidyl-N-methylethanolamine N-methyltransferase